jgi:cyclic pyranopterin phosphate synthase
MPAGGIKLLPREEILSFEEIADVARAAADMGITKLRITGGEPLVRRDIALLVGMLAEIEGIDDLAMTTNAVLLADHADALADAGLQRVNVSLDTVDPDRFREMTGGGDLSLVLAGIEAAKSAGLSPIKLNCVVGESSDEPDARGVSQFAAEKGLDMRFIHRMDLSTGRFSVVEGGSGGDCPRCHRLRLSSDGRIRPCLFSDVSFSVRELGAAQALAAAVSNKPEAGGPCSHDWIRGIGG